MPDREQEKFCMQEFVSWLVRRFPDSTVDWECKDEDYRAPDFWLRHNGSKYAVEITSILHQENQTVTSSQWRLLEEAEKAARDAGELCGEYVLAFDRPLADGRWRKELKGRIRDYVRRTKSQPTAGEEKVRVRGDVICRIRKHSDHGADIFPLDGGVDIGGWEPDIRRELAEILHRCLEAKAGLPAELNCPTILVLHDRYRLARQDTLVECLRNLQQASEFHTVYVVQEEGVGFVITTSFPSPA